MILWAEDATTSDGVSQQLDFLFFKKILAVFRGEHIRICWITRGITASDMSFDKMQKLVNKQSEIIITVMTYQKL